MKYYNVAIIELMEFSEWINQKYLEWRANSVGRTSSVTAFARMFGAKHQLMSQWMEKGGKIPTSPKYINALARVYGSEVYDILGLELPDILALLPPETHKRVDEALEEIRSLFPNNGSRNASPEDVEKINSILLKSLGRFHDTKNS